MEDKAEICKAFIPVCRRTRNLCDLVDLEYRKNTNEGFFEEQVIATFESGYTKSINVNCDSGTAMLKDILKELA